MARRVEHPLEHDRGRTGGQGAVDAVGLTDDPGHLTGAPQDIVGAQGEPSPVQRPRGGEDSGGAVEQAGGAASPVRHIRHEERVI